MLQVYHNELGLWSIGFLTSDDRIVYLGASKEPSNIQSEVLTYSSASYGFFGLAGYLTEENLLASLGVVKVDNPCLTNYKAASGGSDFKWVDQSASQ